MKNLPRTLVLKQLINHKDKVRRRASRILAPARSPPPDSSPAEDLADAVSLPPTRVSLPYKISLLSSARFPQDVRLYVALCLSDVLRIFAPEEPYENDETLKSVYLAFMDAMRCLEDPAASAFQPAHATLQNVAAIGLCVPMLDREH